MNCSLTVVLKTFINKNFKFNKLIIIINRFKIGRHTKKEVFSRNGRQTKTRHCGRL